MTELLAPAGSMEALKAAVANGCDAIYLGMNRFGARAYANNFTLDELKEAIRFCHLRDVKIYVTMNTVVFDYELADAYKQVDELYLALVDGLIIQDLAIFSYVTENYPLMEAHCSTQMGIDDLEGTLLLKELGAKRVVLSREVPIEKIKQIKRDANIPIEIFVHGALCVSYSGNCLLSGLIGYRSGNRGRCVGACRKPYELVNTTTNEVLSKSYILSCKDLNTIEHIDELRGIDSLKIEGRMKETEYVANVISSYRKALDGKMDKDTVSNLNKTFSRTFTKGYIFHEDKKNITNILKPNNFGYEIGYISKKTKIGYEITLNSILNQGDIIRIDHNNEDVNLSVINLLDKNDNLINSSNSKCYIKIKETLTIGDKVYKTKDIKYYNELQKSINNIRHKYPLDLYVYAQSNSKLVINATYKDAFASVESQIALDEAKTSPTSEEQFIKQFDRLNNTIYKIGNVEFYNEDAFIPSSVVNDMRRNIILKIDNERLITRAKVTLPKPTYEPLTFKEDKKISVFCNTESQYRAAKDMGIDIIYYENVVRRNENNYVDLTGELLVGGYGGIYRYRNTNSFSTDFSLNVVNSKSVYLMHKLGASHVCLSHEINLTGINDLVDDYCTLTGGYPNLEMIIYGRADMMFTKYCPLKVMGECGKCKKNSYELRDEYGTFPIISHNDCTTTILNGKVLNLIDELDSIKHVNIFRVQLTLENYEESKRIIQNVIDKLNGTNKKFFNSKTDTRGHFNKEIL